MAAIDESDIDLPIEDDEDIGSVSETEVDDDTIDNEESDVRDGPRDAGSSSRSDSETREESRSRRPSSDRIRTLSEQNRELRDRLDAIERRPTEVQQRSRAEILEEQRIEAERLSLMDPDQRAEYRIQQHEARTAHQLRQIEARSLDMTNKATFDAKATMDERYRRYSSEVEKRVAVFKQNNPGAWIDRELILKVVIGERVLSGSKGAVSRAKRSGQASVDRQRAAPVGSRGDVGETRSRGGKTAAERLRNVAI